MLLTVAIAIATAYLATPRDPVYAAEAQLYVGSRSLDFSAGSQDVSGNRAAGLSFLASSFADMIDTRIVAERALAATNLPITVEEAENATTAIAMPATLLITVRTVHSDPAIANELANGVADVFVDLVEEEERQTAEAVDAPAPVSVFERSVLPTAPLPSSLNRNLFLAAIFGSLVAVGVVVLLEYLDLTIKNVDDAQQRLQLPVLGAIPFDPSASRA